MTDEIELTDDGIEQHIDDHHANLRQAADALGVDTPDVSDKALDAQKAALFGDGERAKELEKQAADGIAAKFKETLRLSAAIAQAAGVDEEKIKDYRTESEGAKAFKAALSGGAGQTQERDKSGDRRSSDAFKEALARGE